MNTSTASTAALTAPAPSASAPEPHDPWHRTQASQHRPRHRRGEALDALAAVLDPGRSRLPTAGGPPLLMAGRAVGEALGVDHASGSAV